MDSDFSAKELSFGYFGLIFFLEDNNKIFNIDVSDTVKGHFEYKKIYR